MKNFLEEQLISNLDTCNKAAEKIYLQHIIWKKKYEV